MGNSVVKQHIIDVLSILMGLAHKFKMDDVAAELLACVQRIDSSYTHQVMKEEVVRYHIAEDEE